MTKFTREQLEIRVNGLIAELDRVRSEEKAEVKKLKDEIKKLKDIHEGQASIIQAQRRENERLMQWVNKLINALK